MPGKKVSKKETKNKERFNRLSLQQPEKVKLVKKPGLTIREKRRLEESAKNERADDLTDDEVTSPSPRRESRDLANSRAYRTNAVRYSKPRKSQVRPQSEIVTPQAKHSVSDSEIFDDNFASRQTTRRHSDRLYNTRRNSNNYSRNASQSVTPIGSVRTEQVRVSEDRGWLHADQGLDNMADQYNEADYYIEDPAQDGYNYNVSTYTCRYPIVLLYISVDIVTRARVSAPVSDNSRVAAWRGARCSEWFSWSLIERFPR